MTTARTVPAGDPWALLLVVAAGLALRLAILPWLGGLGTPIVDEQHYLQLARSLVAGHGLAWGEGEPTSLRPPLYPAFVAAVWHLVGSESVQWVRATQIVLSLVNVFVVYRLGLLLYDRRTAILGTGLFCFYPTLIFFDFLLLTETLFTLLFSAFLLGTVRLLRNPTMAVALSTGVVLGLASLTRSILWPFPALLWPFLVACVPGAPIRRFGIATVLVAGHLMVLTPWAIRNTTLQGAFTIVDTMGGVNLRCGNYEHTPHDRMWDAVSLTGDQHWAHELREEHPDLSGWTEAQKEAWAREKAVAFMLAHPLLTIERSLIRFADFWGLERVFLGGIRQGMYDPPLWLAIVLAGAILVSYPAVLLLACVGIYLAPPGNRPAHLFLVLVVLFFTGIHALIFGHSRYHVPLVPVLTVYAGAAVAQQSCRELRSRSPSARAALATGALFVVIWSRQIAVELPTRLRDVIGY